MLQVPVNTAPGSIASLLEIISPKILAVSFKDKSSETIILPSGFVNLIALVVKLYKIYFNLKWSNIN